MEQLNLQQLARIDDYNGEPKIKDFEDVKAQVNEYIGERLHQDLIIINKVDLQVLKSARTEIRKQKDQVKLLRQLVENQYIQTITGQFKELETLLDNADKDLKGRVDTYEKEVVGKVAKAKLSYLTVKSIDVEKLKQVQDFAKSLGLEAILDIGE